MNLCRVKVRLKPSLAAASAARTRWRWHFLPVPAPRLRQMTSSSAEKRIQGRPLLLIYRWPTMKHFRFISRIKLYQVTLMFALLPLTAHWYAAGLLTTKAFALGGVALTGSGGALGVASHYFSKLAGEMKYDPQDDTLRVSALTFWGHRKEVEFPANDVVTFVESQSRMGGAFQQLEVKGLDRTFLWSLRYGRVLNLDLLCKVLKISDTDLRHF